MANISRITDRLFTGGDLPLHLGSDAMRLHLADMRGAGITHIIDNRGEWNDERFIATHAPDMGYLHNGQDDAGQQMPDSWFDRGVMFALTALEDPGSTVLAHCHMGINRGPSMVYAIMLAQGWPPVAALDAIRGSRPIAAIGYAADALDWWHRLSRATDDEVARDLGLVDEWFDEHPLDVVRTIRDVRAAENPGGGPDPADNSTVRRALVPSDPRIRTTVDIDGELLDAVRLLALETDRRLDDLVDDALHLLLASVAAGRSIDAAVD